MFCLAAILCLFFAKIVLFSTWAANNGFPAIDVRRNSVIPSSVLLTLPVSSCLNTNKEIGLRATG